MKSNPGLLNHLKLGRLLGKGKSAYSYLTELNGRTLILKKMHDEYCPYYTFTGNKVQGEIAAYEKLKAIGINIPVLYAYDCEEEYLLKEYIPGPTAAEHIAAGRIEEKTIRQLFAMTGTAYRHNVNIDYFPTNFVIGKNKLYYIDYEINVYEEEWNLQNWGLYYWANSNGMKKLLEKEDASGLTKDVENGLPIKAPFKTKVQNWIENYASCLNV